MPAQTPQVEMYTNHFLAGGAHATNVLGERIIYNIHYACIHRVQVHGYENTFFTSPSWHNREPLLHVKKWLTWSQTYSEFIMLLTFELSSFRENGFLFYML